MPTDPLEPSVIPVDRVDYKFPIDVVLTAKTTSLTFAVAKNADAIGLSVRLVGGRRSVVRGENLDARNRATLTCRKDLAHGLLAEDAVQGELLTAGVVEVVRQVETADKTLDYDGPSGFTQEDEQSLSKLWEFLDPVDDVDLLTVLAGTGTFHLELRVFHQDLHGPQNASTAWVSTDQLVGTLFVTVHLKP